MSESIKDIPTWKETSALDLLADFNKRYYRVILDADEESGRKDNIVYFERDLHSLIQAFVAEAIKPIQDVMVSASMRMPPPPMMVIDKATGSPVDMPPGGDQELWRGQHCGIWYRIIIKQWYQIQLQASFNASLGEDQEVWQLEWTR
jgi:hypothetical protein